MTARRLVFLIDTNVFIPVEPTACEHVEALTQPIADLERLIAESGNSLVVHPELFRDINRDTNASRRRLRQVLATKYARLKKPPLPADGIDELLGPVPIESHDWIDHHLLASIHHDSVDFLITEDAGLHSKASRIGVGDRVLKVADALEMVRSLYTCTPAAPPRVDRVDGRSLDRADPIFESLRCDYGNCKFDSWLEKVAEENRTAWVIHTQGKGYAGLCIVKEEPPGEYDMYGAVLKVCTFKISEDHEGYRFGELLLKALFDYAEANSYEWLYLTVLPDKGFLIDYLSNFGFTEIARTASAASELVLAKCRRYSQADLSKLEPLPFHVKFGPPAVKWEGVPAHIVPIQPTFHERLFPEADPQVNLFAGHEPHGNAIRKAYLCKSNISTIQPGGLLYFYESRGGVGVSTVGVVEAAEFMSDPSDIVRSVGKRTLYSVHEIDALANRSGTMVLVLSFRQAKVLDMPVPLGALIENGVVSAAPQSVQTIPERGARWIASQAFR